MGAGASTAASSGPAAAAASIVDGDGSVLERARVLLERPEQAARVMRLLGAAGTGGGATAGLGNKPVALLAKSGSGKSTFVAALARSLRRGGCGGGGAPRFDVVRTVFVGAAEG